MRNGTIAAATALLMGCVATPARGPEAERAWMQARPVGPPVDCIETTQIRHTRTWNEGTVDFYMRNGLVYRNRLESQCPGLRFNAAFTYRPTGSRLCSIDSITVLNSGGATPGPSCGLGSFQPIATREP